MLKKITWVLGRMLYLCVRVAILNLELLHSTNNGHHGLYNVAVDN